MSRLTKKDKTGLYILNEKSKSIFLEKSVIEMINDFVQVIGKYEDLEDDLGCPLDVLIRAIRDGIYHNEEFEHPILILDEDNFKENNFNLMVVGTIVYLKDYKKNWWLKKDKSE